MTAIEVSAPSVSLLSWGRAPKYCTYTRFQLQPAMAEQRGGSRREVFLDPLPFVLAAPASVEWKRQAAACDVSPLAAVRSFCKLQQKKLLRCQERSDFLQSTIRRHMHDLYARDWLARLFLLRPN